MSPILKILDQGSFERANLNSEFRFAISIQNKGNRPAELRPDFIGHRLSLYFDDTVEGDGIATSADIEILFDFSLRWLTTARINPALAPLVVHCGAGVSRSAAVALMPLSLYFGAYLPAAAFLFRTHPHTTPNVLILRLIAAKLGSSYGPDILAAVVQGKTQPVTS
jgi:predicted protein tyrosine phosphatase